MNFLPLRRLLATLSRVEDARLSRILHIGLPIIAGMISQSLINLVDAAMVGRIDEVSLAAVGVGSYASFVFISGMMGLSAAVQAIVARHYGAQRLSQLTEPLIAGITISLAIGIPLSILIIFNAAPYIALFTDDVAVQEIAVGYFQWRIASLCFIGMSFVFRGFWSAIGESSVYLRIILIMQLANVAISWLLIFGVGSWSGYGAVGSGMGSAAAMVLAGVLFFWRTFWRDHARFSVGSHLSRQTLLQLVRLALPNSIQQTVFALGISVLFWIIGQIGTSQQAVGHIITQLSLLLILPAVGLGLAGASLVGHSLGAEDPANAHRWGWETARVSMVIMAIIGLPMWIAPHWVLGLFTNDPDLIEIGTWPLRILGFNIAFEVAAIVFTQTLLGAGASKQVMKINFIMQWIVFLPLAWFVGPYLGYGLAALWLMQSLQRIALAIIFGGIWRRQQWTNISV